MVAAVEGRASLASDVEGLERDPVGRLAGWLVVALALDLLLTRFLARLAIFVPKDDPWATLGAGLGRMAAATDAIVAIVGVLLLGALLLRAGRRGGPVEWATLVGLTLVAAGGLALVALPPTPIAALVLDLLVIAITVAAALRLSTDRRAPPIVRAGLVLLAAAVGLAAAGRALLAADVLAGPTGGPGSAAVLGIGVLGQSAFVGGAALVGLGGVGALRRRHTAEVRYVLVGAGVALVVVIVGFSAPATSGALLIWSIGLSAAVPLLVLALALGLAVAGLPMLHRRAPAVALGAAIVLLAGYGLAASGLILAGLLGLMVALRPASASPSSWPS